MDPQLVKRAQKGDERAFEAIVMAMHPTMFRLAYGILRDAELAEDATQRACLDTWRFLSRLPDRDAFEAWTLGHLISACRAAADEAPSFRPDEDQDEDVDVPSSADPFGTVLGRDQVSRAFRRLSFDERTALLLHYLIGLQPGPAGTALGISKEAFVARVEAALQSLGAAIDGDPASSGRLVTQPEGA